ncbi:hypothetical protein BHG04_29170, partial [Klebsiella pneumoniae]
TMSTAIQRRGRPGLATLIEKFPLILFLATAGMAERTMSTAIQRRGRPGLATLIEKFPLILFLATAGMA